MLRGIMHTTGPTYPTPSLTFLSLEPCSSCVAAEVCSAHWVIISKAAAHTLLEMCLLFPQNSPGYSVQPWLLLCLFSFTLHFCKTNACTVIRLLSLLFLIIWGDWARISHWKCFFLQCSTNSNDAFLDFSSLPVYFKKDTRTARIFPGSALGN